MIMKNTILNHNRIILTITGFCPDENDRFPNFCRFKNCIVFLAVFFPMIFMIYSIFNSTLSSLETIECVTLAVLYFLVFVKLAPFIVRRQEVICMLKDTSERLIQKKTKNEQEILKMWKTHESRLGRYLSICYIVNCFVFYIAPLTRKDRTLPMAGYYSAFLYESPWYEIAYIAEIIATVFSTSGMLLCDFLGILFVFHLNYEMDCIALLMKEIGKRKNQFEKAIIRYMNAYIYGQNVCNLLSVMFYIEVGVYLTAQCIAGTIFLKTSNPMIACKMIILLFSLIGHQSIDCYLGEMVTIGTLKVSSAIQQSAWYKLKNKKDLSSVFFITLRDQKPLRLVVGTKCIVNLKTFSDSISLTCSYVMVLKSLIINDFTI